MKWMENEFLAMDKIFSWLKSHFPSISQANIYFFNLGKCFVQADGRGIIVDYDIGIKLSKTLCMFSFVPWSYQKYVDCVATDEEDMFFNKYTLSLQYNSFPEEFSPVHTVTPNENCTLCLFMK